VKPYHLAKIYKHESETINQANANFSKVLYPSINICPFLLKKGAQWLVLSSKFNFCVLSLSIGW